LPVPGDEQYNIPSLSPLLIPQLDVLEISGLTMKMKDVKIFGLLEANVEKMR
jgi:hypothetical protein